MLKLGKDRQTKRNRIRNSQMSKYEFFDFWLSVLEKKAVVIKLSTNMELEKKYCCIKITNEKQQHGNVHN